MLQADSITVRYDSKMAVQDISFGLQAGQWLMLAGPNGAGKSTLIRALAQTVPYSGTFVMHGQNLKGMKPAERARRIGVLSQYNSAQYAYTVEEIVCLGRYAHHRSFFASQDSEAEVDRALERTGMTEYRHTSILSLSGGELQRAFLAQVFAQDPQLLILDEPANHLDLKYQQHIFELIAEWIQQPNRAAISVVHDLSLARKYGTHALLMSNGHCVAKGAAKPVLSAANLQQVYEMDVVGWMREMLGQWDKTGDEA